jgi:hypothetical protein
MTKTQLANYLEKQVAESMEKMKRANTQKLKGYHQGKGETCKTIVYILRHLTD